MGADPDRRFRLRDRLTPVGLSVMVNVFLFVLLARTFTASTAPAERYIAVELERTVHVTAPASAKEQPKRIAEIRMPPKPPTPVKRILAVLPARQEIGIPGKQREREAPAEPDSGATPGSAVPQSASDGLPSAGDAGSSGGASSGGPGAYTGPGDGGGASGEGTGGSSGGHGSGKADDSRPAGSREIPPTARETPKPTPRGESRNAQILSQPRPAYPSDARDDGVEGAVVLTVSIDAKGQVTSAKVARSSGDRRLDRSAVEAVGRWTYSPCLKDGVPVGSSVRVRVEFRLE
ncbi:MAG: energy transducer TonB [Armatimonadetes bacterium]|nr:energy transducer TonB [Armatimonadota bacterium]